MDPNVLISAAIAAHGTPRALLFYWYEGRFQMLVSYDLLYELEAVLLRRVGKRVPTRGNAFFDGGTVAYWSYFDGFHRPFSLKEVRRGDLLLRRFRNNSVDQGHVAVSLGNGPDAPLLQSFHSNGRGLPGLNKGVTVRSSLAVIHYERLVRVQNWINYKGDEF